ncbi:MAG: DNA-directed RNA polymerase subunit beta' [Chloroflexota bacterium]|jgi:DNA-directed RNA polymerase subunit beta'
MLEVNNFNAIRISLASPDQVRDWSKGEVTKPETINYRTLRPEKDGLFDERIFGPSRDWECYCGKYKRIRYKGIICDKCGVEVTRAKVRRERMGHIQLASPVSHIWYFKGTPSRLGILLDISPRNLEGVLYFAKYIVTWVDEDARAKLLQQLEDEAEGRGGRGGQALADLEDRLQADINKLSDELNADLEQFKKEREQERETRTAQLVEAQQATEAALKTLGQEAASEPVVFEETGEVLVAAGEQATRATFDQLRAMTAELVEKINDDIKEKEDLEEAAVSQKIEDAKLEMSAAIEAEQERLKVEAEGLKEEIRRAKEEITKLQAGDLLPEVSLDGWNYRDLDRKYGSGIRGGQRLFAAGMGAEAVRERITRLDLEELSATLHSEVRTTSGMRRKKAIKRLRLIEAFRKSGARPEWMILSVLPVIPPDLRPMVQLDGGRFATSDLNDLYRRVINRNNRLKRLLELGAPEIIIRNEKRMLQEACDALIDNGRRGRAIAGTGNHRLKSLSDMLKGKQGRFRQNLLGKRVDYSGRSVIVVGPDLQLHQCGLPKKMALELFKPFVMRQLVEKNYAHNIKSAKRLVERVEDVVWDVLEEVIRDHPVLLNRAPTLHRLGIQAFMPKLVEGSAIQIHPLVCFAFNADFDGDQMAVHVPLSRDAQDEARRMMLSTENLLSPSDGAPVVAPTQDMILGCYYLTLDSATPIEGPVPTFETDSEALLAFELGAIDTRDQVDDLPGHRVRRLGLHSPVRVARVEVWDDEAEGLVERSIESTVGRLIFNQILPPRLRYTDKTNRSMARTQLREVVADCYRLLGRNATAHLVDGIKTIGFRYATQGGMTIAVDDIKVPEAKHDLLAVADGRVVDIDMQYQRGLITDDERYTRVVEVWRETTDAVSGQMMETLDPEGSVTMMTASGARGNKGNIGQLGGMRGLMADPSGRIIEVPVRSNFREGMSVLEYFISTHGARKGLADTALRTADSGYLTRRLVDVAQDVITRDDDCGTEEGTWITRAETEEFAGSEPDAYWRRLVGRFAAGPVSRPDARKKDKPLVETGELITENLAREIDAGGVDEVLVRSALTCQSRLGVCRTCYGRNLATRELVEVGEAVGIIAAQSIGEPGTQLTMRTFHTGGVAGTDITAGLPRVEELFEARMPKGKAEISHIDGVVEVLEGEDGTRRVKVTSREVFDVPLKLGKKHERLVADGDVVEADQLVARLEKKNDEVEEVRAPEAGLVTFTDEGLKIGGEDTVEREYAIPHNAKLMVEDGQQIRAGDAITEGPINPQEYLETRGRDAVQRYLVKEVQKVYRSQGVTINDKHIEIIVRQMLRKVRIDQPGDTEQLPFELVDRFDFEDINERVLAEGGEPATAETVLLGVTKASLNTSSFLAAASFQETTRVLTEAAINGAKDELVGLKENVIIGKLIPAGTGAPANIARRREEQRIAAAQALAGGELPEGFGEEYNVFLSEGAPPAETEGDGENPFLEEAEQRAQAEPEPEPEPNPFLEGEAVAPEPEPEPNPFIEDAEEGSKD